MGSSNFISFCTIVDSAWLIIFSVTGNIFLLFLKGTSFTIFFFSFDSFVVLFSIIAKTLPFDTLSPILTFSSVIFPLYGEGTSTLDLSLSKVTIESSFLIVSPTLTRSSIISTLSKSPISGTGISIDIFIDLFITQFYLFSAM